MAAIFEPDYSVTHPFWPIVIKNDIPYIRDTGVTVGDILDDCWDYKGDGSAYQHREIIQNFANRGIEITYSDINSARQWAMKVLGGPK